LLSGLHRQFQCFRRPRGCGPDYFLEHRWPTQGHWYFEDRVVRVYNSGDTVGLRISSNLEAVAYHATQLRPEPVHGEPMVRVVVGENGHDGSNGALVIVESVRIDVVEGAGPAGIAVGPREVDGHRQVQFTAATQVVHEGRGSDEGRSSCQGYGRCNRHGRRNGRGRVGDLYFSERTRKAVAPLDGGGLDFEVSLVPAQIERFRHQEIGHGCFKRSHGQKLSLLAVVVHADPDGLLPVATTQRVDADAGLLPLRI